MSHVGERPWWPIQSPNKGRKKKATDYEERERDQIKFIDLAGLYPTIFTMQELPLKKATGNLTIKPTSLE